MPTIIIIIAGIIFMLLFILYLYTKKELKELRAIHEELLREHRSSNIKHGMSFEQLFPFMSNYPYHPRNFRFIGTPIDGLSFEEDKVVFIEFKTGKSNLSVLQQRIKALILRKKVEWKEIREAE